MPQLHHLPAESRVLEACKVILRHIQAHGLAAGDRLPTQDEWRRQTDFSNDTLSAAMRYLIDGQVLSRRSGLGTLVAEPRRSLEGLWTVGLALQHHIVGRKPFYAQLFCYVQEALGAAGCRTQIHLQQERDHQPLEPLDKFHLLAQDVAAGRLDGVVTMASLHPASWATLRRQGVVAVHAGAWEEAPSGAVIDRRPMVRAAVAELAARGARHFGLVSMPEQHTDGGRFYHGFVDGLAALGLPPHAGLHVTGSEGITGGEEAAQRLLATAARPDALVVVDDGMAMGLTAVLREHPAYRPLIAVQTNQQAPLVYSLPVIRYEVDIRELAEQAVACLLERLANPAAPERVMYLPPRRAAEEPRP